MKKGFDKKNKIEVTLDQDEMNKLIQRYKKLKKYQKSSLYELHKLNGTEKIISDLLKEETDK